MRSPALERIYEVVMYTRKEPNHRWERRRVLGDHLPLRIALSYVGQQTDTTAYLVVAKPFVREIGGTAVWPLSFH